MSDLARDSYGYRLRLLAELWKQKEPKGDYARFWADASMAWENRRPYGEGDPLIWHAFWEAGRKGVLDNSDLRDMWGVDSLYAAGIVLRKPTPPPHSMAACKREVTS